MHGGMGTAAGAAGTEEFLAFQCTCAYQPTCGVVLAGGGCLASSGARRTAAGAAGPEEVLAFQCTCAYQPICGMVLAGGGCLASSGASRTAAGAADRSGIFGILMHMRIPTDLWGGRRARAH